ncbi:MAG: hypothetical protein HW386_2070 [Gammaproteobacteria bacterium]|nr:hypothetical protein [Gammaproteobacteria bacterium]
MKMHQVICAIILTLTSLAVSAQGATGKWSASLETPQGPFDMTFEFAVDGNNLTGTMSNAFGATPISDGKINGNDMTFVLSFPGPDGGAMTIDYKATVNGDEMNLISSFRNPPAGAPGPAETTFTAKRAQ